MINNINPGLYPQSVMPQANAVNIQIFNPQAYGSAPEMQNPNLSWNIPQTTPYPPINTPIYQPQYTQSPAQPPASQNVTQTEAPAEAAVNTSSEVNNDNSQSYVAPIGNENLKGIASEAGLKNDMEIKNSDSKKTPEADNAPKVVLSDEYIKNLENYLNSQDPRVRLMGAKELLERFKEDNSRANDKALNALLNKTIQDPNNTVKFVGLTILDAGYSKGNDETVQILKNIQQDTSSQYGEDSLLASQILLKMSANNS